MYKNFFSKFVVLFAALVVVGCGKSAKNSKKDFNSATSDKSVNVVEVNSTAVVSESKSTQTLPCELQKIIDNHNDRVYFKLNSSSLSDESVAKIKDLAQQINKYKSVSICVEGFADYLGTEAYNKALSIKRAESVKKVLLASGVDSCRICIVGYGKSALMPEGSNVVVVDSNWANGVVKKGETKGGYAKNRAVRVSISLS